LNIWGQVIDETISIRINGHDQVCYILWQIDDKSVSSIFYFIELMGYKINRSSYIEERSTNVVSPTILNLYNVNGYQLVWTIMRFSSDFIRLCIDYKVGSSWRTISVELKEVL
jgi:hypothetical protein